MQHKSYNISEVTDKQAWDDFVTSRANHTFLHSWAWGEFNEALGDNIWRFGAFESGRQKSDPIRIGSWSGHGRVMVGSCLMIKVHARRGNFLFIPHGPLGDKEALAAFVNKAKELAGREGVGFIRVSPLLEDTAKNQKLFRDLGFRPAPVHMHAETTWSLDLAPSEDELMVNMRKTTRNLIRRAEKEGVEIRTGASAQDGEVFYDLYKETVAKHNFTPFSSAYLKRQVEIFAKESSVNICTAWYNNEALASAIIVFYGNSAFYHHGASRPSKIPATYLLQWKAIREAKRRGHGLYNFWGVIKEDAPRNHPWQGITLFKKGFGGFQTDYLHAQDLPFSWKYWPSYIFEVIRRRRRNL